MKVFIKKATEWGAKLVSSRGKHLKFRDSLGHQISAPKTSSDWRSIKNFESELRRKGFVNQNTATKVKNALSSTTKPKVKEIKLSPQQRRLSASANRKAGGLSLQNFMRKIEGKDLIQPTPTSRTTIKSLPANKLGKQPTLTQTKLKPSSAAPRTGPKTDTAQRMEKGFDDRLDALIQSVRNSPRRRVNRLERSSTITSTRTPKGERKKISRAELDGMNIPQKQKDALIKQGLVGEQMVVPRGLKKKNPLMNVKTEMELLKRLSNRKTFYDAARTGRAIYPFSEDNKHRDAKLNYQYKQVTNPKRPEDPIKKIKKGLV